MNASCDPPDADDLHTISAAGFSATVDAFARDDRDRTLWFLSMVGSQTALKAIWAALLKQPPEAAHLMRGADGTALSGGYQRCMIPPHGRNVDHEDRRACRQPEATMRSCIHEAGRVLPRERLVPAARRRRARGARPAPPVPRPQQSPAPPPLLGRLALGQGHRHRRDRPAAVGGHLRVPLQSRRREAQKRPVEAVASGTLTLVEGEADMDRTLRKSRRGNRRRQERNLTAWQGFSPDGDKCRYCPTIPSAHVCPPASRSSTGPPPTPRSTAAR